MVHGEYSLSETYLEPKMSSLSSLGHAGRKSIQSPKIFDKAGRAAGPTPRSWLSAADSLAARPAYRLFFACYLHGPVV